MAAGGVVARRAGARLTDGALGELAAGEDVERLAQAPGGAWIQFRRHGRRAELAVVEPTTVPGTPL